jgi:hypothetical protein
MAYPSTFLDLQTAVKAELRLDPGTADDNKIKDAINIAYVMAVVELEANVPITPVSTALVAGTSVYTLDPLVARIIQMYILPAGSTQTDPPLERVALDEILQMRANGGDILQPLMRPDRYSLTGLSRLDLWPTPPAADSLKTIYVAQPTALSANGDIPILVEPYASQLLFYAACAERLASFKDDPRIDYYRERQQEWTERYRDHLDQKGGDIPAGRQWGSLSLGW